MGRPRKVRPEEQKPEAKTETKEDVFRWLEKSIPELRRCRVCWNRYRGHGIQYGRVGRLVYYRCTQCNCQWIDEIPRHEDIQEHLERVRIAIDVEHRIQQITIR